jgi:hypothetical protein
MIDKFINWKYEMIMAQSELYEGEFQKPSKFNKKKVASCWQDEGTSLKKVTIAVTSI